VEELSTVSLALGDGVDVGVRVPISGVGDGMSVAVDGGAGVAVSKSGVPGIVGETVSAGVSVSAGAGVSVAGHSGVSVRVAVDSAVEEYSAVPDAIAKAVDAGVDSIVPAGSGGGVSEGVDSGAETADTVHDGVLSDSISCAEVRATDEKTAWRNTAAASRIHPPRFMSSPCE
jgi:hypothetical protein